MATSNNKGDPTPLFAQQAQHPKTDNEAALFCKPAAMPTEHDQMFKQWIWGINITQQGRPNVSIMQEMLDAAHEERRAVVILLERLKIHSG
ncbi:hypothetical protein KEM48_011316 [Puccinia striiformis f. sp. tritici PST-130]|uniref:Uncharacterized protein n=1 Tax=Puccinia striiformis f. sp. tritici PST-78 TaxID=1165861 RepID=A0A0L0V1P4_9BASI|nr:hypothetical protein KEM48_011316 [Puccinia striiformis f. sp. tritici PST-130]KNE93188.1 hypothetical protein PSTG_13439 [Puccinia striiformis f. sp. tritici PST-78]